jgi:hypothetical protein
MGECSAGPGGYTESCVGDGGSPLGRSAEKRAAAWIQVTTVEEDGRRYFESCPSAYR